MNDIPEQVGCSISMFADDTKIYTTVKDITDSYRLQADLNSLVKWARDWLLRFNVSKCKHMSIGTKPVTSYSIVDISNVSHSLSTTDCKKVLVFGYRLLSNLAPSARKPIVKLCRILQ